MAVKKHDLPGYQRVVAALGTSRQDEPIRPPLSPAIVEVPNTHRIARGKFTQEAAQKILSIVQAGNTREVAFAAAGISKTVAGVWCKLAANGEEPFAAFVDQIDKAEASLEAVLVAIIRQKAQEDPNVAFRLLERRFPQRWAPGAQPTVSVNIGQQNQMTPADARAVMRDLFGDLSPKQIVQAPTTAEDTDEEP